MQTQTLAKPAAECRPLLRSLAVLRENQPETIQDFLLSMQTLRTIFMAVQIRNLLGIDHERATLTRGEFHRYE